MKKSIVEMILEFIRQVRRNRRWQRAVTCVAALVVFVTTYALILPAITMEGNHPRLASEKLAGWAGDPMSVSVSAESPAGSGEKVVVLTAESVSAGLSEKYEFDAEGITVIEDKMGQEIRLHRTVREDAEDTVDYWFVLAAGQKTEFDLDLQDEIVVDDVIASAGIVENVRTNKTEEAEKASASDAVKVEETEAAAVVDEATASNAMKASVVKATASNTAKASASDADEEGVDVDEETGEINDGAVINDLDVSDIDQETEVTATLKLNAGMGDELAEAIRDAEKNAEKRGNASLEFRWKMIVNTTQELEWSENGVTVHMYYNAAAKIPDGAHLSVAEIPEGSEEYQAYLASAEGAVKAKKATGSNADREQADAIGVSYARFFDITILDAEENEIQPASQVVVKISYDEAAEISEEAEVKTVHFPSEGGTEVIDAVVEGGSTNLDGVAFNATGFSVYGVVGTQVITTEFLSANGNVYDVTVTYGPEAEIPDDAKLIVKEYIKGSAEYEKAKESLMGKTVNNDNGWFYPQLREEKYKNLDFTNQFGGFSLLDISIVDGAGAEIEPKAAVSVKIIMKELPADTKTDVLENSMELKHFVENNNDNNVEIESLANTSNIYGETGGEITVNSDSVLAKFDTDSFSLFAFTWGSRTANVIVHYVDEDGNDIQGTQTSDVSVSPMNTNMSFSTYEGGITNYTFKEARLGKLNGEVITGFTSSSFSDTNAASGTVTFTNNSQTVQAYQVPFNAEVYFIYTKNDSGQGGGDSPGLKPPTTKKELKAAGDGTYTISLSVTGTAESDTVNTKANVIVIYDTSNSMNYEESTEGGYVAHEDWGRYGLVDGEYVQLYTYSWRWGYQPITNAYGGYGDTVYYLNGDTYTEYNGTRYSYEQGSTTRHAVASNAVKDLAEALLSNNTNLLPDMVEMALIEFDSIGYRINGGRVSNPGDKTRSYSTFEGWVDDINVPGSNASNAGGTDWEDALTLANNYSFGDNDPVYIIFISDGNPTFRVSRNGSSGQGGANTSQSVSMNGRTVTIYGQGNGDTGNYNLDAAIQMATTIVKANKHLYSVGAFGDATNMQRLAGAYYDANNQTALNEAFADIVGSITSNITFANVEITDGLTAMTASTFVSGEVGNFIYYRDGKVWTAAEMAEAGASEATVVTAEDGSQSVEWNLGEDFRLEKNIEYKIEFTVWPKQEAYDLLADLNNGKVEYDSLSDDVKKQIIKHDTNPATYTVLTNTDAAISYDIVSEQDGEETGRTSGSDTIENPTNGMGLDESHLDIKKVWNDSLDPQQLLDLLDSDPNYSVTLHIRNDNNEYVPVTIKPEVTRDADGKAISSTWPTEKVYIAPGVMLSEEKAVAKGINVNNYKKVAYNGTTYVILESGHDYSIDEHNTDYHFELRAETYHPMVVDGTVCNVSFKYDASGAISEITAIDTENTGTIVATNELRAGINMRKIVLDANGKEIYPKSQAFKLKVSLKDKDGKAIKFSDYAGTASSKYFKPDGTTDVANINWDTYPIWFNVYYGANDDLDLDGTYDRSEGMVVEDGGYIFLKAGEVIRFSNVPIGTQFAFVEEDVPAGYEFTKYEYKAGKATTTWTTEDTQETGYGATAAANQSYYLKTTNTKKAVNVRINKKDQDGVKSLKDAKFDLYPENAVDDEWKLKPDQTPVTGFTDLVTDDNGQVTLSEIPLGTYFLVEKEAPAGFKRLEKAVKLEVTAEGVKFTQTDRNGGLAQDAASSEVDGVLIYDIIVSNNTGTELPNTGGRGTLPFRIAGLALMLMGAAYVSYDFKTRRRRERRLKK